jgi:hypothetical protein
MGYEKEIHRSDTPLFLKIKTVTLIIDYILKDSDDGV